MTKMNSLQPSPSYNFSSAIDLWDETLREGAERATIAPTLQEKCTVAIALSAIGVRSIVVGMFPDVPHNIELLTELLRLQQQGDIHADVRFLVISHVGITFDQTLEVLSNLGYPLGSVWIIVIHSVSDLQIQHLFPTILKKDPNIDYDEAAWQNASDTERRQQNLRWLESFLPKVKRYSGGGIAVGLLDFFRADFDHCQDVVALLCANEISQIRLVDTAGTCIPQEVGHRVRSLVEAFPGCQFYGHFHNDYGMATGNALLGLALGLAGVDVSVGGFANRAGHPPLAEVAVALRDLYGVYLQDFNYQALCELSREVEKLYGLMECPTQPVTGVITHGILSGIRTELIRKAPMIFDQLDPSSVGASLKKMFGVRSGIDGMQRFLLQHQQELGLEDVSPTLASELFVKVQEEWVKRSASIKVELQQSISEQQALLSMSAFTEDEMQNFVLNHCLSTSEL